MKPKKTVVIVAEAFRCSLYEFLEKQDIYADHMVKQYDFNQIPLERIDNSAFMIGKTGTCYYRGNN